MSPAIRDKNSDFSVAAVAQWIEYWPPKPRVVGSIPASRTTFFASFAKSGKKAVLEFEILRRSARVAKGGRL